MEHPCDLAERIGDLLFDNKTSDVVFIVEGEFFPAHKAILSTSSQFFRALLFGNMKESLQSEISLEQVPLRGFKLVMSYVYTGQLNLEEMDMEIIVEILELAHLYGFEKLQVVLCKHLQEKLDINNVCPVFDTAHRLQLKDLSEMCYRIIFEKPLGVLENAAFCDLSESALLHIIADDRFCAKEIEIFQAVARWCENLPVGKDRSGVLQEIRLPLIDYKDLVSTVADSGLIARDAILEAIRTKECGALKMRPRASMSSGVNLASPDQGAYELKLNPSEDLFTVASCSVYGKRSLPPYPSEIKVVSGKGLTVALRQPFFINHIAFKLPLTHSYYIEVSMDLQEWVRVIDHEAYKCRSSQRLYFEARASRFIRLIFITKADVPITDFEVSHIVKPFKVICGFYAPEGNIATEALGTLCWIMKKEHGSEKNERVNLGSSKYITHEIGAGSIHIWFPRPYTVSTIRMLLRNDESQAYKYFVETSMTWKGPWKRVADNTTNFCRSWQRITFDAHPVLHIRIVGVASSADKYFSVSNIASFAAAQTRKRKQEGDDPEEGTRRLKQENESGKES